MTYTAITDAEIDQDSPISEPLHFAIRDNLLAGLEQTAGAPVARIGWHPYDSVLVGDSDGEIYDFATDGSVSSITTPDFEDGYEYRLRLVGFDFTGVAADLDIEQYLETTGSYGAATALLNSNAILTGTITFFHTRLAKTIHPAFANLTTLSADGAGDQQNRVAVEQNGTSQKILRVRLSGLNTQAGKIFLERRRDLIAG